MSENSSMESPSVVAGFDVDWEERYRRGDTPWEKGQAHPALVEWLATNAMSGRVIVPGCGLGHDVRVLARAGEEVIAVDVAPFAIAAAEAFPRHGKESYILGDFFDPGVVQGEFDWVFEHTLFCAIRPDRREDYARRVTELLKPGGRLLAIFFLEPEHDESDEGGPPFGCSLEELDTLFSPHFQLIDQIDNLPTYPGREAREILRLFRRL
jgi:SAM-dependent methyltransferase